MVSPDFKEPNLAQIRTLEAIGDIAPVPGTPEYQVNQKLLALAQNVGLIDMREVLVQYLDLNKYLGLSEAEGKDNGQVQVLGFILEPTLANREEIFKKLTSGLILSFAMATNERFKILWQIGYQLQGILGETWEKGYYVFRRTQPSQAYLRIMETYADKFREVQNFYREQISIVRRLVGE